jgi:hypothetical protein
MTASELRRKVSKKPAMDTRRRTYVRRPDPEPGRPKYSQICVYVPPHEIEEMKKVAKGAGYPSVSEYVRAALKKFSTLVKADG